MVVWTRYREEDVAGGFSYTEDPGRGKRTFMGVSHVYMFRGLPVRLVTRRGSSLVPAGPASVGRVSREKLNQDPEYEEKTVSVPRLVGCDMAPRDM